MMKQNNINKKELLPRSPEIAFGGRARPSNAKFKIYENSYFYILKISEKNTEIDKGRVQVCKFSGRDTLK